MSKDDYDSRLARKFRSDIDGESVKVSEDPTTHIASFTHVTV